ncbi:MAG: hypothetical protein QXX95_05425 [Nitrososphaerales archaeon]
MSNVQFKMDIGSLVILLIMLVPLAHSQPQNLSIEGIETYLALNEYNFTFLRVNLKLKALPDNLELNYPSYFQEKLVYYEIKGILADLKLEREGNLTKFFISFKEKIENLDFTLNMVLKGMVKRINQTHYSFPIALAPSSNLEIKRAYIEISLPPNTRVENKPEALKGEGERLIGNITLSRGEIKEENLVLKSKIYSLSFPYAERIIEVDPSGEVKVSDIISVVNEGDEKVKELRLNPLSKGLFTAKVNLLSELRMKEESNIPFFVGRLPINKDIFLKEGIEKGERLNFVIGYDFPKDNLIQQGFDFKVKLDSKPPIDGFIEVYKIKLSLPQGFILRSEDSFKIYGANLFKDEKVEFLYSLSPTWTIQNSLPLASLLFVASYIIILLNIRRKEGEKRDEFKELSRIYDEKFSSERELLNLRLESIKRESLANIIHQINSVKSSSSSKIAEIKGKLKELKPEEQKILGEISFLERDFDKTVTEILNLYGRIADKRINLKIADKLIKEQRKKIEGLEEKVREKVKLLS